MLSRGYAFRGALRQEHYVYGLRTASPLGASTWSERKVNSAPPSEFRSWS